MKTVPSTLPASWSGRLAAIDLAQCPLAVRSRLGTDCSAEFRIARYISIIWLFWSESKRGFGAVIRICHETDRSRLWAHTTGCMQRPDLALIEALAGANDVHPDLPPVVRLAVQYTVAHLHAIGMRRSVERCEALAVLVQIDEAFRGIIVEGDLIAERIRAMREEGDK